MNLQCRKGRGVLSALCLPVASPRQEILRGCSTGGGSRTRKEPLFKSGVYSNSNHSGVKVPGTGLEPAMPQRARRFERRMSTSCNHPGKTEGGGIEPPRHFRTDSLASCLGCQLPFPPENFQRAESGGFEPPRQLRTPAFKAGSVASRLDSPKRRWQDSNLRSTTLALRFSKPLPYRSATPPKWVGRDSNPLGSKAPGLQSGPLPVTVYPPIQKAERAGIEPARLPCGCSAGFQPGAVACHRLVSPIKVTKNTKPPRGLSSPEGV